MEHEYIHLWCVRNQYPIKVSNFQGYTPSQHTVVVVKKRAKYDITDDGHLGGFYGDDNDDVRHGDQLDGLHCFLMKSKIHEHCHCGT